ncbi:Uncharacterised protein [Yersinia frederiksenii]|nr:Uncharacterised protein [Yersinia frederiksenii]
MNPVRFHERLEYPLFAFILLTVTVHKGFHTKTGLDIVIPFPGHTGAVDFFMVVGFNSHPGHLRFGLNKVARVFRGILAHFKGIATLNRRRYPFGLVLFISQILTINGIVEPAVLCPAIHIQARFIGFVSIPGTVDAGAVTLGGPFGVIPG